MNLMTTIDFVRVKGSTPPKIRPFTVSICLADAPELFTYSTSCKLADLFGKLRPYSIQPCHHCWVFMWNSWRKSTSSGQLTALSQ